MARFPCGALAVLAAICPGPAGAAEPAYPVKPIRMIIANVAGGTSDILARVIGAPQPPKPPNSCAASAWWS